MLDSEKEERSRHFKLAIRVGIPVLVFISTMSYWLLKTKETQASSLEWATILGAMVFVIVYFIYFALELSRKETLLDRITGGYHYNSFIERAKKSPPETLAVLQVNNLGVINENFGVTRADATLRKLIDHLNSGCVGHIYIGRKNGSEFLIAAESEASEVENALKHFTERYRVIDDIEIDFSVAVIKNNIEDLEKTIDQLRDIIVRRECKIVEPEEKSTTSSSIVKTLPDAQRLSEEEQEVLEALEKESLAFQFRPLKNLHTGEVDIYEVSVKLKSPRTDRAITPKVFLPIINRKNFGEHYDFLIFKNVLNIAKLIDDNISLSFNISPFSLRKKSFTDRIFEELDNSSVKSSRLMVELYERKKHHRLEEYLERLKVLKSRGIRLCLDNFGSSNASMEYIRHFPFDMIQLDRDFVLNIDDEKNLYIIKSFVSMAREMNMLSGAKWVDSQDKVDRLKELNIDYIQGFVAGKILNERDLIDKYNPVNKGS